MWLFHRHSYTLTDMRLLSFPHRANTLERGGCLPPPALYDPWSDKHPRTCDVSGKWSITQNLKAKRINV